MYIPVKLKWDTLSAFKRYLETETDEKIVSYNGYELVTESTVYGIVDSQLNCRPRLTVKQHIPVDSPKYKKKPTRKQ